MIFLYSYFLFFVEKFLSIFPLDKLPKEGQLQCQAPQFSGRGGGKLECKASELASIDTKGRTNTITITFVVVVTHQWQIM